MTLFKKILASRNIAADKLDSFLSPNYSNLHDPFLLNDMEKAVERIRLAKQNQDKITIYGDYDIDGLTATTLLADALKSFGLENVDVFMPSRFIEGYGLNISAIDTILAKSTTLIITVDCGSSSIEEVEYANKLGIDVIVTDHHSMSEVIPPAVAVINPKRQDNKYPFTDLAGVGVAFKLVQALQKRMSGIEEGKEKWLLDLVALGTVCDVVNLLDENRIFVYWGLNVLSKTRRPGLKALMSIASVDQSSITTRSLGFALGPRMNAAGRLETAKQALDLLLSDNTLEALDHATNLDELNKSRRSTQDKIFRQAIIQADKFTNDNVLVLSSPDWNHGVVGIVASKIMEKFEKPAFIFQELSDKSKGSGRSYGRYSAIDAINSCRDVIEKGGGHEFAAGVTLDTKNIPLLRKRLNDFYIGKGLVDQHLLLLSKADVKAELDELDLGLFEQISQLEPFGMGNPQPILQTDNLVVLNVKKMGTDCQHVKMELSNGNRKLSFIAFNAPDHYFANVGDKVSVWYNLTVNEWRGNRSVEGQLLRLELHN